MLASEFCVDHLETRLLVNLPNFGFQRTLPGAEFDIPTDRDQRSWVFLDNPKNTLPLTENPNKCSLGSKTLKNTLSRHDSLSKSYVRSDNDEKLCSLRHLVNETGPKRSC